MAAQLSEYELERLERIKANAERMKALNLPSLAQAIAPPKRPAAPTQRGVKKKRLSNEEPAERRRSERIKGLPSDGAYILHEGGNGQITTTAGGGLFFPGAPSGPPPPRHTKDDVPLPSTGADAAFLDSLSRISTFRHHKPAPKSDLSAAKLIKYDLIEENVAKCTKSSTTHLAFMPTANTCLLAAGDKKGGVGLWHIDYEKSPSKSPLPVAAAANVALEQNGGDEEADAYDGIIALSPHSEYVSGLKWAGGDGAAAKLFTGSYDGSLRMLDVEKGAFVLAWGDVEMEYSCMEVSTDGNIAYMGDNQGTMDIIDLRAGKRSQPNMTLHNRKVNTVHIEPVDGRLLLTSSTDSSLHCYDLRKFGPKAKPVSTAAHNQTCQAAYFAPNGSKKVVSTSFDDTVRIWDASKSLEPLQSVKHDNQTGRWVLPFRAVWNQSGDAVIVGNMKRYVDVIDVASGKLKQQLSSEYMTAIASRHCVHPVLPILASATASGRVHLYQ